MRKNFTSEEWRNIYNLAEAALDVPEDQRAAYLQTQSTDMDSVLEALELAAGLDQPEESSSLVGTSIGRFELLSVLGRGGAGEVYSAHDPELRRTVAIKILSPESTRAQDAEGRFVREARTASALNHPNIVTIYEILRAGSMLAIVMEFVDGVPLRRLCDGTLPLPKVLSIGRQVAAALAAAHNAGIVHRDIKPENVMILSDGRVKVLDFGLAKWTEISGDFTFHTGMTGIPPGTLRYMSPEHYRSQPITAKSDVFALGLVLFELSTGRYPFSGESPLEILHSIAIEDAPAASELNASIPPLLDAAIAGMLAKNPDLRWTAQTAESTLTKCEAQLQGGTTSQDSAPTIAVLPFASMGADPDDRHFSDGLTEEIINALAQVKGLHVIARTSAFAFHGRNEDVRRIAQELGANYILEGSVRRSNARIRITSQLIRAADGVHLSSKRYDRESDDVFAIQDDISADIATHLKLQLNVQGPTNSSVGRQGILTGQLNWHRFNTEGLNRVLERLHDFVKRHPKASNGYSAIAMHHIAMCFEYGKDPRMELEAARDAARTAISIDDSDSQAYASLADTASMLDYDWREAERCFRRALDLNAVSQVRIAFIFRYLLPQGRLNDALIECRRLLQLDPVHVVGHALEALTLFLQKHYDESVEACERCMHLDADFPRAILILANIHALHGRVEETIVTLDRLPSHRRQSASALLAAGTANAIAGNSVEAQRVLEQIRARSDHEIVSGACACLCAVMGDAQRALDFLDKGVQARDPRLLYILTVPWFATLHAESRYRAVLQAMNLHAI
jgi:serine/threonine protein kinase/tetratricopeptide (TPR) repeat protein